MILRRVITTCALSLLAHAPAPTFESDAPVLSISHASERPAIDHERAALILLRGLPEHDVAALADALDAYVSALIAQNLPIFSLEEATGDPAAPVDAWLRAHARETTSAIALAANAWQADDGFRATLVRRCPEHGECVSLEGHDDGTDARRARFVAWVVSRSRIANSANARSEKHVALILDQSSLDRAPSSSEERMREQSQRLTRLGATDAWIAALAKDPPTFALPRALHRDEVFLVPDISAITAN
ncbi:MAG: hypothetical protein ABI183_09160 [Polyangiaceae bacterium]